MKGVWNSALSVIFLVQFLKYFKNFNILLDLAVFVLNTLVYMFCQEELSSIKKQVLQGFSPDDDYPLGGPLFMETPRPCSPLARMEFQAFDEVIHKLLIPFYLFFIPSLITQFSNHNWFLPGHANCINGWGSFSWSKWKPISSQNISLHQFTWHSKR